MRGKPYVWDLYKSLAHIGTEAYNSPTSEKLKTPTVFLSPRWKASSPLIWEDNGVVIRYSSNERITTDRFSFNLGSKTCKMLKSTLLYSGQCILAKKPTTVLSLVPQCGEIGHSDISGRVPSCLPWIKPNQSGRVSEDHCGLIALAVHIPSWLSARPPTPTGFPRGLWRHLVARPLIKLLC